MRRELPEAGFGGSGEVAVASSVATSSVFGAGEPQEEQKREMAEISLPQEEQAGIEESVYRVYRGSRYIWANEEIVSISLSAAGEIKI